MLEHELKLIVNVHLHSLNAGGGKLICRIYANACVTNELSVLKHSHIEAVNLSGHRLKGVILTLIKKREVAVVHNVEQLLCKYLYLFLFAYSVILRKTYRNESLVVYATDVTVKLTVTGNPKGKSAVYELYFFKKVEYTLAHIEVFLLFLNMQIRHSVAPHRSAEEPYMLFLFSYTSVGVKACKDTAKLLVLLNLKIMRERFFGKIFSVLSHFPSPYLMYLAILPSSSRIIRPRSILSRWKGPSR